MNIIREDYDIFCQRQCHLFHQFSCQVRVIFLGQCTVLISKQILSPICLAHCTLCHSKHILGLKTAFAPLESINKFNKYKFFFLVYE